MGGLLHLVQRGGTGRDHSPPRPPCCTKCNSQPINGQCTNFVLFAVALWLPLESKGLKQIYVTYREIKGHWTSLHQSATQPKNVQNLTVLKHELSYRKGIARQLRTQYVEGIYRSNYPWPWNLGQGSLKVTENDTIWKLGYGFYSPSIVTMAVSLAISQIFTIKKLPDLQIWVWCRSRSVKMARFDRPCTTFYWSVILTIAPSCTIFEFF